MQVVFGDALSGRGFIRRLALFGLLFLFGTGLVNAEAMKFRTANLGPGANCGGACPRVIVAEGEIDDTTAEAFLDFVQINGGDRTGRSVVFLHSPGGRVVASMRLGEIFRLVGAVVAVARVGGEGVAPARCYSACVYALMGARKRVIPPGSEVGVHRMFMVERLDSEDGSPTSRTYAHPGMVQRLTAHARKMGVNPELIQKAERIAPEHMHVVSSKEMRRWRLAVEKF